MIKQFQAQPIFEQRTTSFIPERYGEFSSLPNSCSSLESTQRTVNCKIVMGAWWTQYSCILPR